MIDRVTVLHGHTSPDTAYIIDNYPYSFHLRCTMRIWIDGPADKGQYKGEYRVMRQTDNPRRAGRPWNNPKKSTYDPWVILYLDTDGKVGVHAISYFGLSGSEDARMRLDGTYDQLTPEERDTYDQLRARGQHRGGWDAWLTALDFITAYRAEHGVAPDRDTVRAAPGFYLDDDTYDIAVAAAG